MIIWGLASVSIVFFKITALLSPWALWVVAILYKLSRVVELSFESAFNKIPVFKSMFKFFLVSLSDIFTSSLYLFFSSLEDNSVLNLEAVRAGL